MVVAGPFHAGVHSLITHLWNRGIPVVAWYEGEEGVVLLCARGRHVVVSRAALGGRTDRLAQSIAEWWPYERPNVLDAPSASSAVPELSRRVHLWWQFLRYLVETLRIPL
jgi:hypothetical protein